MIIIPAAGQGSRFREAGYGTPKHLLPLINGESMIDCVAANVRPLDPNGRCVYATQDRVGITKGSVETLHRAIHGTLVQYDEPLVIANCDQLIDIPDYFYEQSWANGAIFTFLSANTAHSYVETSSQHKSLITGIIEKPGTPQTDWKAVSGVYYFTTAGPVIDAVRAVYHEKPDTMYFSVVLARMIAEGYNLFSVEVPTAILGTPEDFQRFQTAARIARAL